VLAITAATARAASTQATGASLSLSLTTSRGDLGPFVTTNAAPTTVDENNGVRVDGAGLTFGAIDVAVAQDVSYTVTLVPQSDLVGAIDPSTGSAMLSGQFTMSWQNDDTAAPACQVGPFTINASTAPFGSSPYSAGAMTVLDGAPSVPASQGCADFAVVNDYVPLPVEPANAPAGTVPNPAWTLQVALSPAPTLSTPTTTTTTTTTTSPPSTTSTGPVATTPNTAGGGTAATPPPAPTPVRYARPAGHPRTPLKTKAITPTTAAAHAQAPAPIDPSLVPIPPSPGSSTDAAGRLNSPNPNAIDPVPASAKDPSSLAFLIGVFVVIIAAVAFALPLIGRDIRRLLPGRSRERLGGPITLPPGGRDANGPASR